MDEFRIKPKKEINWPFTIRATCCFLICVFALLTICIWTGAQLFTFKHFIIFSLCAMLLSILYSYTVEKLGSGLGGLFSGRISKKINPRDHLSADLEKARYSKRNDRFEEALSIINGVLNKDESFPDALFLKAQILWEGFGRSVESKSLFRKVKQSVSADDPLYVWSTYYIDKITEGDKMRAENFLLNKPSE